MANHLTDSEVPSKQHTLKRMLNFVGRGWTWLTRPADALQKAEYRRRARLLAALLVFVIPLFLIPELIRTVLTGTMPPYLWWTTFLLLVSYGLSRTRHYRVGTGIVLFIFTIIPTIGIVFLPYEPERLLVALVWIIPTVLLGSLLVSLRGLIALILGNILLVLLLPYWVPMISINHLVYPLGVLASIFILLIVGAVIRQQDLDRIETQADELAQSHAELEVRVAKRTHELAEANTRLKELDQLKSRLIKDISHEFVNLKLLFQPAPDNLPQVLVARKQLRQVVVNLVENGLRYTVEGQVIVATSWDAPQQRVGLHVSDTGIGITPEDQEYLFERFFRGQESAQANIPGMGLGLAYVKEVVEIHGGSIEVESQVGEGSL